MSPDPITDPDLDYWRAHAEGDDYLTPWSTSGVSRDRQA